MRTIYNKKNGNIWDNIKDNDAIPKGWIDVSPKQGLIHPVWDEENNKWKEGATQEEINTWHQLQLEEQINALNEKFEADGKAYQKEIKNRVTAQLVGRPDAIPIMREINKTVYVLLDKIAKGDWALAMLDYLDGENNPTIPEVVELFDEVGRKAIEYYQNEYPH